MGDIVTSLIVAGLQIEFLHEFPYTVFQMFQGMEKSDDGNYRFISQKPEIPLIFSLRAKKGD